MLVHNLVCGHIDLVYISVLLLIHIVFDPTNLHSSSEMMYILIFAYLAALQVIGIILAF